MFKENGMREKEMAQKKFIALMEKTIQATEIARDRKVIKAMNAVDSNGNVYTTEAEIMDAYGYEMITDAERHQLLEALEYRENRPHIMEDYLISLCRRAMRLVYDDSCADVKKRKARENRNAVAEIKRNGRAALTCSCCEAVVGEVDKDGRKYEYPECTECSRGRVCEDCLRNCRNQCKERI